MKRVPYYLVLDCTAKKIPLWMYYVRTILQIVEGILTLFSLLFYKQFGFSLDWSAYMLRRASKARRDKLD